MRAALMTMLAAACLGVLVPGASAAWTEPTPLPGGGEYAQSPQLAYDGAGNGVAAWIQGLPANAPRVMTADRPAGEAWQPPVKVSLDTRPSGTTSPSDPGRLAEGMPGLAVNDRGDTLVVWAERDVVTANGVTNTRVRARLRPAGGAWGPTRDVSALTQGPVNVHDVTLSDDGEALASWGAYVNASTTVLHVAHLAPGASDWGAPDALTTTGEIAQSSRIATTPDGDALVVWRHAVGGTGVIRTRTRSAAGTWGAVADVPSPGTGAQTPQLGVDADGDATVLFTDSNGTNRVVRSSRRTAGATSWPTAAQVSTSGGSAEYPALVVEPDGDALAAWSRHNGSNEVAQAARVPATGSPQTPHDLSAAGVDALNLALALDDDGTATAAWTAHAGSGVTTVQAARRSPAPDRAWGQTRDVATATWQFGRPAIAVAPGANATVVWSNTDQTLLGSVDFDAATPSLGTLVAPPTGVAGTALAFSVQATGATRVTWDLGDGTAAEGTSASHAYAAAGTYTVTVRATDGFGLPATASATVTVTAPGGSPDPGGPGGGLPGDQGGGGGPAGSGGGGPGGSGGAAPPPNRGPAPRPRLRLQLAAPAQRLATVARRRAVTLTCTLPAAGRCTVRVTVNAATARALGLKVPKGAKRVTVGTSRATVAARTATRLRLRLGKRLARRLAEQRSVVLLLAADGVAADGRRTTATTRVTLRR